MKINHTLQSAARYCRPVVERIDINVEVGFAGSIELPDFPDEEQGI